MKALESAVRVPDLGRRFTLNEDSTKSKEMSDGSIDAETILIIDF
jgi:hypothetical protein